MKKRIILAALLALTLLFCVSCGGAMKGDAYAPDAPSLESGGDGWGGGAFGDKEEVNDSLADSSTSVAPDRKIIKTVNQTVETEEYDKFIDELRSAVSAYGGYVSNSSYNGGGIYNEYSTRRASFEIRIPAERLDEFTAAVGGLGAVTYYQEWTNDVTLSYVDITGKISVLEAEEAALLAILAKAETTADLIAIRESLTDVQGNLASLRAQKKVLDDKVAYSTVNLTLREVKRVQSADIGFLEEVGNEFSDSLEDIGYGFRSFFVWLIGDSLYILIVCAVATAAFFVLRAIIRRLVATRVKKKAENTQKDGE